MNLKVVLALFIVARVSDAQLIYMPTGNTCDLTYGEVTKKPSWVCDETEYTQQPYPKFEVDTLLEDVDTYGHVVDYLNITQGCQSFIDKPDIQGSNDYYYFRSMCKMKRRPVRMIWAQVPGYTPTATEAAWREGLLPVHVLEGQSLFDVECVHPWADGRPGRRRGGRGRRRRLQTKNIYASGFARHLCLIDYGYLHDMVCKASGFVDREVLVYSQHANLIFSVIVPDVPTSCVCAQCECTKGFIPAGK